MGVLNFLFVLFIGTTFSLLIAVATEELGDFLGAIYDHVTKDD